jgi:acyl-coenzyme A synthetase/AMP-(fatty) acid ligase
MKEHRDHWLQPTDTASATFTLKLLIEDPLFILYTSGSTGQNKGMLPRLHSLLYYYSAYTALHVFQYNQPDVYVADIGWITGS